jgi:hypothetical protein
MNSRTFLQVMLMNSENKVDGFMILAGDKKVKITRIP